MAASKIEWTQETWNAVVGCSIVSPGCTNCYAMNMAARIEAMNAEARERERANGKRRAVASHYDGTTKKVNGHAVWTGKLARAPDNVLLGPLRRKKPTMYFVNSMSDLFHQDIPDEWIDQVFAVMALTPQHTYQVLTKRAARMRKYMTDPLQHNRMELAAEGIEAGQGKPWSPKHVLPRVLDNVWLGVSTERQKEADERIPLLLQTPAAVRFISAEPLLGPIDLRPWLSDASGCEACDDGQPPRCHRDDIPREEQCPEKFAVFEHDEGPLDADGAPAWITPRRVTLNWVITGGESGPNARPSHPDWYRNIRDACAAAGVAYFHKQNGEWLTVYDRDRDDPDCRRCDIVANKTPRGQWLNIEGGQGFHNARVVRIDRVGKKAAGRLLDGRTHDDMPSPPDHVITPARRAAAAE